MSRTARAHDRENAPRQLQHATRGRHLPPLRRTTRRPSGVQHVTWHTGYPVARGAQRENGTARFAALARIRLTAARSGGPSGRAQLLQVGQETKGRQHEQECDPGRVSAA